MGVASTLWPIAFAAVLGPTLRTVALYNAECGVTLQVRHNFQALLRQQTRLQMLEMLSSSYTLVSTMKACINLQFLSIWTFVLLVLWSLSPAGGQAVLRSITIEQPIENTTYPLVYCPSREAGVPFDQSIWGSASSGAQNSAGGAIRMIFGAVLSAPNAAAILANGTSTEFEQSI